MDEHLSNIWLEIFSTVSKWVSYIAKRDNRNCSFCELCGFASNWRYVELFQHQTDLQGYYFLVKHFFFQWAYKLWAFERNKTNGVWVDGERGTINPVLPLTMPHPPHEINHSENLTVKQKKNYFSDLYIIISFITTPLRKESLSRG